MWFQSQNYEQDEHLTKIWTLNRCQVSIPFFFSPRGNHIFSFFIILSFKKKFIYLFNLFIFGCVGSSLLRVCFLQLRWAGATLRCGARALGARASVVGARGLSSCGFWALECRLSSCGARASLLRGVWELPGPGLEPLSPALVGGFLTTAPPGKPLSFFNIKISIYICILSSFTSYTEVNILQILFCILPFFTYLIIYSYNNSTAVYKDFPYSFLRLHSVTLYELTILFSSLLFVEICIISGLWFLLINIDFKPNFLIHFIWENGRSLHSVFCNPNHFAFKM